MAFSEPQQRALKAKLKHAHVKTRDNNGAVISYVEGWLVIAEANRIFGFDRWDRQTLAPTCVWSEVTRGQTVCFYSTKVRITVRTDQTTTVREGIGTGVARSPSAEVAHDMAVKAAETDATKRALATFGNPFGLALYDRDHTQVTKPRRKVPEHTDSRLEPALVLRRSDGTDLLVDDGKVFVEAILGEIHQVNSLEGLYDFWSANLGSLTQLFSRTSPGVRSTIEAIVAAFKQRLRQVGKTDNKPIGAGQQVIAEQSQPIGMFLIPKEKRLRDRAHLAFVAKQPCLVCGRRPAQAHHLRFAQPRAMSLKVSDEFTLPLCNIDHDALHRTGDERAWWARHGIIDPLKIAARLWAQSRERGDAEGLDAVNDAADTQPADIPGRQVDGARPSSPEPPSK